MKSEIIKELCEVAFKTYRQPGQTEEEWEKWIKEEYENVTIISKDNTQSIVVETTDKLIVSFRGTEPTSIKDLRADWKVFGKHCEFGFVHRGFLKYFKNVKDDIFSHVRKFQNKKSVYVTGHSLGGAAATICAVYMQRECGYVEGVVTFGSPRVGDAKFRKHAEELIGDRGLRVENNNDIVPRIPPPFNLGITGKMPQYRHCFDSYYFNRSGVGRLIPRTDNKLWSWLVKEYDRILGYKRGDLIGEHSAYVKVVKDML